MPESPHQKNIVHGSVTAGGNVHIGDYLVTYNNYFAFQEVKIPNRLTNNIPTNADHILGRATELAQAKGHLAQHQATILFNGIGGIGKTALASKYMAVYGGDYKHLAWITVQSTLAEAFTSNAPLLASLQITQQVQDYISAKQLDKAFEYLFHQLNLLDSALVVIDNANDIDDLEQYKNWFDTANCHFLITSRSQPSEWPNVIVGNLPEDDAIRLFRNLNPSEFVDNEAIINLLSKLFFHTLLIELVAKAAASAGLSFIDLQTIIDTQFIHHESLNEIPVSTGKHGSVITTNLKKAKIEDYIWLIFSQLEVLGNDSKQTLKSMSLLPVATPFSLGFVKEHLKIFNIPNSIVLIDSLIARGWLQKVQSAEGRQISIKIHPLIADMVVEHLNVDVIYGKKHIDSVIIKFDSNKNEKIPDGTTLTLALRLNDLFFHIDKSEIAQLQIALGTAYLMSSYQKSLLHGERALQIAYKVLDKASNSMAIIQNNFGIILRSLGEYNRALVHLKNALVIHQENENTMGELTLLNNIGDLYRLMGDNQSAEYFLEKALALFNLTENNTYIKASILNNLAQILELKKDYDKALLFFEEALRLNATLNDYSQRATIFNNISSIHFNRNDFEKTLFWLKESLSLSVTIGDVHSESRALFNISQVLLMKGDNESALHYLEKALDSFSIIGDEQSKSLVLTNIGILHYNKEKYEESLMFFKEAYQICQKLGIKYSKSGYIVEIMLKIGDDRFSELYNG